MIDTRREGWPAHGVEALVALYAAGEARIEPWFGEPVADGDRIAVEWRVVVEEDGAEVAFAGTSLLRFRGHRAMRLFMRACESGSGAGQGRKRELRIEPSEILRLLEIQAAPPVGFKNCVLPANLDFSPRELSFDTPQPVSICAVCRLLRRSGVRNVGTPWAAERSRAASGSTGTSSSA